MFAYFNLVYGENKGILFDTILRKFHLVLSSYHKRSVLKLRLGRFSTIFKLLVFISEKTELGK